MADAHKNFAYSTIATGPSPATSGSSFSVQGGDGAKFPAVPFNVVGWPIGTQPTTANAEILRVTAIATDAFTVTRAQEGTTGKPLASGYQIMAGMTAKTLTDIEGTIAPVFYAAAYATPGQNFDTLRLIDGAITAGLNVLTSAAATFTIADVNKKVTVWGAGLAHSGTTGSTGPLNAVINGFTDAHTVSLSVVAVNTVSGAIFTYGHSDRTAVQAATTAALNNVGGGIVQLPYGNAYLEDYVNANKDGIHLRGGGVGSSVVYSGYKAGSDFGIPVLFDFSDYSGVPGRNPSKGSVTDISFDLNSNSAGAFAVRPGNAGKNVSNFRFAHLEIYNKGPDSTGSLGGITLVGTYGNFQSGMSNITIDDLEMWGSIDPTNADRANYGIAILANDLIRLRIVNSFFHDMSGLTISKASSAGTRGNKDWLIDNCAFINTQRPMAGTNAAYGDFNDGTRNGFTGIKITNSYFEQINPQANIESGTLDIYNSTGFIVDHCIFVNPRRVIAPGHSFPSGNESVAWQFSNNIIYGGYQFADPDGHFAGKYSNNVFMNIQSMGLGGYGRHDPTVWEHNFFINCPSNPDGTQDYQKSLFSLEQTGTVVRGNVIYTDPALANPVSAPTVAINGTAGNLTGAYIYRIVYFGSYGYTLPSPASATVSPSGQQVNLSFAAGPTNCWSIGIYRTAAGGADGTQKFVGSTDGTQTGYTDNQPDNQIGNSGRPDLIPLPLINTTGTKSKYIFYELFGGGAGGSTIPQPNFYIDNVVFGEPPTSGKVFGLESAFRHVIQGNQGLHETTLRNINTNGTLADSPLAITDVVEGNFTDTGVKVQQSYAIGSVGATVTISRANGEFQSLTQTAATTFTILGANSPGDRLILEVVTGGFGQVWPANFKKAGGSLTLTGTSILEMRYDGTNWNEVTHSLSLS